MADEQLIKPRELPPAVDVFADDAIMTDDGVTVGKATPVQIVDAGAPVASQAEAVAGINNTKRMTPLTVKQVLDDVTAPSVTRAQAWAESIYAPDPAIPGSRSSKSWALTAEIEANRVIGEANRAENAAQEAKNAINEAGRLFLSRDAAIIALPTLDAGGQRFSWLQEGVEQRVVRDPTSVALPGLVGWRPADNILDISMTGSPSELATDFVGRFRQACDDAASNGWDLNISQNKDFSPYQYEYIDHVLVGDLRLRSDPKAVLRPSINFQHFATNGTVGPFNITDFNYSGASDGQLSAMLVYGTIETKLYQGVDFTVSGKAVTLTTAAVSGGTLVVVRRKNALQLRAIPGTGRRLTVMDDLNIDLSDYGYAIASASGSGLATTGVDHVSVNQLSVYSPAGYGASPLAKRGDSAFTPLDYKSCVVQTINAEGMNDLALYSSGGASSGPSDDARGLYVGVINATRCSSGMKHVRGAEQATVGAIHLYECGTGYISGETDGLGMGRGIHIGSINAVRLGRRALDVRDSFNGGVHVGAISVRDIGYYPDGTTLENDPAGVYINNARGVQVDYLSIQQRDWSKPTNVAAVQVSGTNNYGNKICGGWVEGLQYGVRETGATTNDIGNSFTLNLKNVDTPIDSAGALHTDYDLTVFTETAGVVTKDRINSLFSEALTGTPTIQLAGATNSPSFVYAFQTMAYRRMLDYYSYTLRVQATVTHSEPSPREVRVQLPAEVLSTFSDNTPITVGLYSGLTLPANLGIFAVQPAGTRYVRFYYLPEDGSAAVMITSAHLAPAASFRMELSGLVKCG